MLSIKNGRGGRGRGGTALAQEDDPSVGGGERAVEGRSEAVLYVYEA